MLSSKTFDPYYKWLGIRPEEQPANYYRLLGIALYEDDADAIAGAADQRMAHIRSFQAGNYAAFSQRLLNELAAARICLLNPQKKAAYDQALRARFTPPSPPVELLVDDIPDLGYSSTYKQHHKKSTPSWMPWAFVVVGGLVVVIIFTVIAKSGRDEQAVAKAPTTSMPQPASPKIEPKKVEPKVEPKPQPKGNEKADSEPITETPPAETKLEPAKLKLVVLKNPDPLPEVEAPKTKEPAKPQPEQPFKEKLPIPDDAAQEKVMATIRDIYKDDYKDKTALARKLIQKANETQNTTDRFVLLQEAKDLASETWQGQVAFEAIDAMASEYDISSPEMKAAVIEQAAKKPRITAEQKTAIANAALQVVDEAIGEDKFDAAKKAGRIASQLVRQTKDKDLLQEVVAKGKQVGTAAKAYADAQEAIATLKDKPDDPDANVAVGKYLCFNKGNWAKGLPMLAKGNDAELKALAAKDIAGTASADEQAKLGDAWWGVSTERASYWYEQALPGLTGLEKDRVEKRVAGISNVYLADLKPTKVQIFPDGYSALAVSIKGKKLAHGLWAPPLSNSFSKISYQLSPGGYRYLIGVAGIAECPARPIPWTAATPVTFRIMGDGKLLWRSQPMQKSNDVQPFHVRIQGVSLLELFVDCPGSQEMATALWIDPVLTRTVSEKRTTTSLKTMYLSDLNPQEAEVIEGNIYRPATFKGQISPRTLWAHPPAPQTSSYIAYDLNKRFHTLRGAAGIGHEGIPESPLTFRIVGDGKLLWKSRPVQVSDESQNYDIDVSRIRRLEFFVDCPGGTGHCWGIWIDPVLTKTASEKDAVDKRVNEKTDSITIPAKTYLADLTPASAIFLSSVGIVRWENSKVVAPPNGPTPLEAALRDSHCAQIAGNRILHGLWGHPPAENTSSRLSCNLGKQYRQLNGAAGISDNDDTRANFHTPLIFRIVGDGRLLWRSQPMQKAGQIEHFEVVVAKIVRLELFVDCMGNHHTCQAVWIDPVLTKTTSDKVGVKK